jgi:hypothetical protein
MSNARKLADLLDSAGDIKAAHLDNVTPTTSASDLTSGTLPAARISSLDATKLTGTIASGRLSASNLGSGTVPAARLSTATTQSVSDNSTKIATTAYTDAQVATVVDSAPGTLNTLNELAAALGDDANFSTTTATNIAAKLPLAGGTMTGDLNLGDGVDINFGDSTDLKIYHEAAGHNYVDGSTDCNILIRNLSDNRDILLQSDDGSGGLVNYVQVDGSNGQVRLYHYGDEKFNTASTGIEVTGDAAITGDSSGSTVLTLTSNALADTPLMVFQRTGGAVAGKLAYEDSNTAIAFGTTTSHELKLLANNTRAIQINSGGDIIFYDSAGDSEDLFWDASESRLGIGRTSPDAKLDIRDTGSEKTLYIVDNDNVCNQASYGVYIDKDISGSDTCTTDRVHIGIRLDTDSSATGGTTTDEHRIYGIHNTINSTGDSDLQYAAYNYVKAEPSAGTVSTIKGAYNYAVGEPASGATVSNVYGAHDLIYAQGAGDITNMYAVYSKSNVSASYTGSNVSNAYGSYNEVEMDAVGTLDNAYGVRSIIDRDAGTITSGYLFHGDYQGTLPTNAYGVYIADDVDNYFAGNIGLGTSSPRSTLDLGQYGQGREISWHSSSTLAYASIWTSYSGARLTIGSRVKGSTTVANGYESTIATAQGRSSLEFGNGDIAFFTAPATTTAYGAAVTLNKRLSIDSSGNILLQNGSPEFHFGTSSASHVNWRVACQEVVSQGFEIASGTTSAGEDASSDTYTTRFSIESETTGGDVKVHTGNLVIGTAGKGIMFHPHDETVTTPGSDSNLLDDYEEGTWSASFADSSGNSNAISGNQLYTKIGRVVTVMFEASNIDTTGLVDNDIRIMGLPFTSNSDSKQHGVGNGWWHAIDMGGKEQFAFTVTNNVTYVSLRASGSDTPDILVHTGNATSGTADLYFSVTYFA